MPANKNTNEVKRNRDNSFRKPIRKAPGTRMGTLEDWRGGNNNSGKTSDRHGESIRDGR